MIVLDIEQGTPEWDQARLGVVTASMMSCIISSTGKPSTQSEGYRNQLLSDWHAGEKTEQFQGNKFTELGHEREDEARSLYEFLNDVEVTEAGFCFKDDRKLVGCSPDGLVGDDGLLEIKSPKGSVYMGYVKKYAKDQNKIPSTYYPQVQAQLWVTGRQWCDFIIYHPKHGHLMFHVKRDESFITKMSAEVAKFVAAMVDERKVVTQIAGEPNV